MAMKQLNQAYRFAASLGKPCALIPCNECPCVSSHPIIKLTTAYVQACIDTANQNNGRFELVNLVGAPFSRALLVQSPLPAWAEQVIDASPCQSPMSPGKPESLTVPVEVLKGPGHPPSGYVEDGVGQEKYIMPGQLRHLSI